MWKSVVFSLFLILQTTSIFPSAEGLLCYNCWNVASLSERAHERAFYGIDGHKSCGWGKIPDKKLKKTCLPPDDSTGRDNHPVCAQLYVEVPNGDSTLPLTVRSCFYANKTIEDLTQIEHSCGNRTFASLLEFTVGNLKEAMEEVSSQVPPNSLGEFCSCNTDSCNVATGVKGGSVMILVTVFTVLLESTFFRGSSLL